MPLSWDRLAVVPGTGVAILHTQQQCSLATEQRKFCGLLGECHRERVKPYQLISESSPLRFTVSLDDMPVFYASSYGCSTVAA